MSDYQSRKAQRTQEHARSHGVKLVICGACNGSGHYDRHGSPPCGACRGLGKVEGPLNRLPTDPPVIAPDWRSKLAAKQRLQRLKRGLHDST